MSSDAELALQETRVCSVEPARSLPGYPLRCILKFSLWLLETSLVKKFGKAVTSYFVLLWPCPGPRFGGLSAVLRSDAVGRRMLSPW